MGPVEALTNTLIENHLEGLAAESGMAKDSPRFTMAVLAGMMEGYNDLISRQETTDEQALDYIKSARAILDLAK